MKLLLRLQVPLFLLALLLPSVLFLRSIILILPLYTNSELRERIKTSLTEVAEREGWLLSNISVNAIRDDQVFLVERVHRRGSDPETCHILLLSDNSLHPCDAKLN